MEIEENVIIKAAEAMGNEENAFRKLLFYGEIYKNAGLTPIYLVTEDFSSYAVSCVETFGKKLH